MTELELTPELGDLAQLLGTWVGEGQGHYPTIESFAYRETVSFGHRGKPFLTYEQATKNLADGLPLHAEVGYLRPVGHGKVELMLAHPFGIAEVEEGTFSGGVLELRATTLAIATSAKRVQSLRRRFELVNDRLTYDVWMAHGDTPETHHLRAELRRVGP